MSPGDTKFPEIKPRKVRNQNNMFVQPIKITGKLLGAQMLLMIIDKLGPMTARHGANL